VTGDLSTMSSSSSLSANWLEPHNSSSTSPQVEIHNAPIIQAQTLTQAASASSCGDEQEHVCSSRKMSSDSNTSEVRHEMQSSLLKSFNSLPLQNKSSLDEIRIEKWDYPRKFREKHFDVLLMYTVKDELLAEGFRYVLEHCITLEVSV